MIKFTMQKNKNKSDFLKYLQEHLFYPFSIEEHEKIIQIYLEIFEQTYYSSEELGQKMDEVSLITKYNLKYLRPENKKKENFVFVCSCIAKKREENLENEENEENDDEEEIKIEVTKAKKTKRKNKNPCNFRISFIKNNKELKFVSLRLHNHAPEDESVSFHIYYSNLYITIYTINNENHTSFNIAI